ncbi:MAG: hypothetical protein NT027_04340 [Proteobacteria bacterium]|nr:hypothetical protein [Pseudomonadota bacterium]
MDNFGRVVGFILICNCVLSACKPRNSRGSTLTDNKSLVFDDSKYQPFLKDEQAILSNESTHRVTQNQRINRAYAVAAKRLNGLMNCAYDKTNGGQTTFQANWFHFGVWASRQAGDMISGKDSVLLTTLKSSGIGALRGAIGEGLYRSLGLKSDDELADKLFEIVEKELAAGNLHLAVEILPPTTRFIELFKDNCKPDLGTAEEILKGQFVFYNKNPNPLGIHDAILAAQRFVTKFGKGAKYNGEFQDLLYHAFHSYLQAMTITDPRKVDQRVELILLGNLLIGFHEQMILQTYIQDALGSLDSASTVYKSLMTKVLMILKAPKERVGCGMDVEPGLKVFDVSRPLPLTPQKALATFEVPDLKQIASDFKIVSVAPGASVWTEYDQRMKYISGVFINEQTNASLGSSPYRDFCLP